MSRRVRSFGQEDGCPQLSSRHPWAVQMRGQGPLGAWFGGQRGSRLENTGVSDSQQQMAAEVIGGEDRSPRALALERQKWGVLAQQGESPHQIVGEAAENLPRAEHSPW